MHMRAKQRQGARLSGHRRLRGRCDANGVVGRMQGRSHGAPVARDKRAEDDTAKKLE